MSYELIKQWIDDPDSVTEEEIQQGLSALYTGDATQQKILLIGALSSIKAGAYENVPMLIERYERRL